METVKQKGLTGTGLKLMALGFMLLDHIHYFFGFTGMIPEWFSMVGRLAAPIFLFCVIEGFTHTHDRKRYFLRVLAIAAPMGALQFFMTYAGVLVRPDGFYPVNGIMMNFLILMMLWQGMDWLRAKKFVRGALAILLPLAWPFAAGMLAGVVPQAETVLGLLSYTLLPSWAMILDGGTPFILLGVLLYAFRKNRKVQVGVFIAFEFLYDFCFIGHIASSSMPDFHWSQMFTMYYEWLGVFAAVPMLCYNGQRGRGLKVLFYVFYPAHVYLLYAASWLLYTVLK